MGIWGLEDNAGVLEEERGVGGYINPTSNFAEMENADFWRRVGGKRGGYLTRGQVVQVLVNRAVMQIARRVEFERSGLIGEGPGVAELQLRGEMRKRSFDNVGRGVHEEETNRERGKNRRASGVGMGDPQSRVLRGGESGGGVTEKSTHRHDQRRVEKRPEGLGFGEKRKRDVDLNEEPGDWTEIMEKEEVQRKQRERWAELERPNIGVEVDREEEIVGGGAGPWMQEREADMRQVQKTSVETWEEDIDVGELKIQGEQR